MAYHFRGGAWYKKGDFDRASSDIKKALSIKPTIKVSIPSTKLEAESKRKK
jgi:hypothetical protein